VKPFALLPAVLLACSGVLPTCAYAGSANWKPHPTSGDWNTAANWRPATVPNGPYDTAIFGTSDTTDVFLSSATEVNDIIFKPGAIAFTIAANYPPTLVISGIGVVNNSGATQNFVTTAAPFDTSGISFRNKATAGTNTVFTVTNYGVSYGTMAFYDEASAASGTFIIEGADQFEDGAPVLSFYQDSTAANGIFTNTGTAGYQGQGGVTWFMDNSTAANGTITNKADTAPGGYFGAATNFSDESTAGESVITNEGAGANDGYEYGGSTVFADTATAGNATVTCEGATAADVAGPGQLFFYGASSATGATLIANGGSNGGEGGLIQFWDTSSGGTARVELFGNGTLDISRRGISGITIGSLEGDGIVTTGPALLTVGTNNLSTVFGGEIHGSFGAVTKVGLGTLSLSGANTYGGSTFVEDGFLKISNRTGSATGIGTVVVQSAGTLGGGGTIAGSVAIGDGGVLAPGTGSTTLTVKRGLGFTDGGTYAWRVKTSSAKADKVIAGGVTISPGALFNGIGIGSIALSRGTAFTAMDNTSANPINGTFSNLPDGGTITVGSNTFQANYEGGDGNDLTLTVVP
jgi:autotransporter-associated beta strand protein